MKHLLALGLALVIVLSLTACGKEETNPTTSSTTASAQPDQQEPEVRTVQRITKVKLWCTEDNGDPVPCHRTYEYQSGKLVRVKEYRQEVLESEWTYDGIDRPLTKTSYKEDGSVFYREEYHYDENGNVTIIDPNNESIVVRQEFNEDGQLILNVALEDGQEYYRDEYRYDGGLLAEVTTYINQEEVFTTVYDYDDQGRLVAIGEDLDGEKVYNSFYGYDEQGNLTSYYDDGTDIVYEYDENGNLISYSASYTSGADEGEIEYETVAVSEAEAQELAKIRNSIFFSR